MSSLPRLGLILPYRWLTEQDMWLKHFQACVSAISCFIFCPFFCAHLCPVCIYSVCLCHFVLFDCPPPCFTWACSLQSPPVYPCVFSMVRFWVPCYIPASGADTAPVPASGVPSLALGLRMGFCPWSQAAGRSPVQICPLTATSLSSHKLYLSLAPTSRSAPRLLLFPVRYRSSSTQRLFSWHWVWNRDWS